jgi:hypothetical protein
MKNSFKHISFLVLILSLIVCGCKKENKKFIGGYAATNAHCTDATPGYPGGVNITSWFAPNLKAGSKGNQVVIDDLVGFNGLLATIDGDVLTVAPVNGVYSTNTGLTVDISSCVLTFSGTSFNFTMTASCIHNYPVTTTFVYTGSATKNDD